MSPLNSGINKGFEAMLPKTQEVTEEYVFHNEIRFSLFGRNFFLGFHVKKPKE
jgi:hypothetical protein